MWVDVYSPTLLKYYDAYVCKCSFYQRCAEKDKNLATPLQPIAVEEPCQQWCLDVIGEKNLHLSKQHRYIITIIDYFTQWVESIPLKQVNDQEIISFLNKNIISRFEIPNSLVLNNAKYISSLKLYDFVLENEIILKHSANYYPQVNGFAESTNKNLIHISMNTIFYEQRN